MKKSHGKNNNRKRGELADFMVSDCALIYRMTHDHKNVISFKSERSKRKLGIIAEQERRLMVYDHQLANLEYLLEHIISN